MRKLFVDTGAFYAMADRSDRHHREAARTFQSRAGEDELTTTDHVFVEAWFLIRARLGRPAAMGFWDRHRNGLGDDIGCNGAGLIARPLDCT